MERDGKLMAKCTKCGREFERTRADMYWCGYCASEYKASYKERKSQGLPPLSNTCSFCGEEIKGKKTYLSITRTNENGRHGVIRPRKRLCKKCADLFIEKLWGE